jgi:branched-chain amino acid transport system substrate-binding protein
MRRCELTLKRTTAFAASVLLSLPAVAACTSTLDGGGGADLVIAADLELSGAYADVGTTYQRALQLKVDQVNADGGIQGHKLRLNIRDNRSDPTVSLTNVAGFLDDTNLTAIVTGACSDCLLGIAKTVNDKGIPTVSLAPAAGVARPVSARKYIFKIGPNSDDSASVLANELKDAKLTRIALVSSSDTAGNDAMKSLSRAVEKVGLTVVDTAKFQATDTDLAQPVRTAVAKHPDALVVAAFSKQALVAAKNARDAGFTGRIYFDQVAAGELFLGNMGTRTANGITMVGTQSMVIDDVIATSPAKVERRQWFNDYTAKYGNFSEYSTYAADAVQLVDTALLGAGATASHDAVRVLMESSQFEGLAGQIHMTPENHSGLTPQALTVLVARGDRWRPA